MKLLYNKVENNHSEEHIFEREAMVRITLRGEIRFMVIMIDTIAALTENE